MRLATFKRIIKTDYPQQFQDLVDQLSVGLNNGIQSLYTVTQNNISLKDNISCTLKTVKVTVDDTGKPTAGLTISLNTKNKVQGLVALKVDNLTSPTSYTTSGVNISFNITNNGVEVTNIKGLIANNQYQINVVVFQD